MYKEQLPRVLCSIFVLCLIQTNTLHGQFLKSILKKSQDKIEQKLSDKIADKIAEEITARALRSIDESFDDAWQSSFPKDSITGEIDWNLVNESYGQILTSLSDTVSIPATYSFEYTLEIESKDYSGNKSKSKILLNSDGTTFGMLSEDDGEFLVVFDSEKDAMIMYDQENQNYRTIANYSKLTMNILDNTEITKDMEITNIEATGKTKEILKYDCNEYKAETNNEEIKYYLADSFPVSYGNSLGTFIKQFQPTMYQDAMKELNNGMILNSENKSKTSNKKSSYEAKKLITEVFIIDNSRYNASSIVIPK